MELSLDLSLSFFPKTISMFLGDVSRNRDTSEKLAMLEDSVQRLEDEMRKIEAFKRELPLCMLLVNDAITRLKEEKVKCIGMQDPSSITEEFMTLKSHSGGNIGPFTSVNENCDRKNWMSSAQLWSTKSKLRCVEDDCSVPNNSKEQRNITGGALLVFNGNSRASNSKSVPKEDSLSEVPNFSLMTPASELNHSNYKSGCDGSSSVSNSLLSDRVVEIHGQQPQNQPPHLQQNPRKQRRCWSPELHRRFVDALQRLGGAQVATPKQIRDLMQVEGLTNDEVKSHLQKYRLHIRRFPDSSVGPGPVNNALWMAQDQCAKGNLSQSSSPQGPLLLKGSVKGISSHGHNSMDAQEDEQSDCRNWKGGLHHQPEAENHSI